MPETDGAARLEGLADTISVADAMREVLAAERDAEEAINRCQRECQSELEAAQAAARRIADRAEQTAQAIHGRIERVAAQRAARHRAGLADQPGDLDPQVVAAAVERLAERLTGRES